MLFRKSFNLRSGVLLCGVFLENAIHFRFERHASLKSSCLAFKTNCTDLNRKFAESELMKGVPQCDHQN